MKVKQKYGIQITKPWSNEMYEHNDKVAKLIKIDLFNTLKVLYRSNPTKDELNEFVSAIGGIRYGDGYNVDDLYDEIYQQIVDTPNYILNDEYDYLIDKEYIEKPKYEFIGYDN